MEAFLLIAAVVVIIVIPLVLHHNKKVNESWAIAARRLKLKCESGSMFSSRSIRGRTQGYSVIVDTFSRRRGNNSTTYTRYRVGFSRSLGLGLHLQRQGAFSGSGGETSTATSSPTLFRQ